MKLSKTIREEVAKRASDKVYAGDLEKAYAALVNPIVEIKLRAGDRLASTIPEGWEPFVRTHNSVNVYICLDDLLRKIEGRDNRRTISVILDRPFAGDYDRHSWGGYRDPWKHPTIECIRSLEKARQDFYFDCLSVLSSCQTVKQLEETSPDLFALLPPPSPTNTQLVPVETLARVQTTLRRGGTDA